jgi:hypothetical protein
MSEMSVARPVRKVAVADHIWDAFEAMAVEMGSDRDGLINQALFMFARLNGYLSTGTALSPGASGEAPEQAEAPPRLSAVEEPPADEKTPPPAVGRRPTSGPPGRPPPRADPPRLEQEPLSLRGRSSPDFESDPRRRSVEPLGRQVTVGEPEFQDDGGFEQPPSPARGMDGDPDRIAVAERVLETAAELERLIKSKQQQQPGPAELPPAQDEAPEQTPLPGSVAEKGLYLVLEEGELDRIAKDRFLIGRGKHCDLVINSGKVSREHAAIVRESGEYFIEDLGSSNGTWFNKQRIKRRKIEDGDEYFICSDKLKCVFR